MKAKLPTIYLERALFRAGERVCVAVSGGADSVALLLAMVEANTASPQNKEPLGVVLSVAHVHHGLRGAEADGDEAFVRALCDRLGVPLRVFHVDTPARQLAAAEGLEEAARSLRYGALRSLIAEEQADSVATAHTLDDQAETVLMKLLRGAWTEGLGGISPLVQESVNGTTWRLARPLLGVRRAEIEAYLKARGEAWREDSSNRDHARTRNRIRHELLPMLRTYNPAVDETLARTAEIAREEEAYWQAEVARLLPQMVLPGKPVRGGGRAVSTAVGAASCAVEIARLAALASPQRRRLLRAIVRSMGLALRSEETAKVLALAGFGGSAAQGPAAVTGRIGSRLELHGGLRVERSARELRFERLTD
jgi:tRNA(Ile)-lysidine synthase